MNSSFRSPTTPVYSVRAPLGSHQQERIPKSFILSRNASEEKLLAGSALRRVQSRQASWQHAGHCCWCGGLYPQGGDKRHRHPCETGAEVAMPLAGPDLLEGIKIPTLPLQDSAPKGSSLSPGTE